MIRPSLSDAQIARNIGGNITRERRAKDLSCNDLARFTGTYPRNITRIEDGDHMPGAALLARIANVLGVDLNHLIYTPAKLCRPKGKQTTAERREAAEADRHRTLSAAARRTSKRTSKRPAKKKRASRK
jgi:transcriptional regulator with XRE-family HTH domain